MSDAKSLEHPSVARFARRIPPHAFFLVSAVCHYLGPGLAVLLFAAVPPLGVAFLRIASAAVVFALWRRPWRAFRSFSRAQKTNVIGLGLCLAAMNVTFYLAIAELPLATVGAIEFLGPIALAAAGLRSQRNTVALSLAAAGVAFLTQVHFAGTPIGYLFAFANCALFVLYIVLGHRIASNGIAAEGGASGIDRPNGIDGLAAAMLIATVAAFPFGLGDIGPALRDPLLLGAAIGVGIVSSVIPYVCDQLAMARLPRATFALLLSLLPATAAAIGILLLDQIPTSREVMGIALVIGGVALHRSRPV
jgi:inner membrane transporter RhtA